MNVQTADTLANMKCAACEGGVQRYSPEQAEAQLSEVPDWRLTHDGQRIRRDWTMRNFMAGLVFFSRVAKLAEQEGHHPDLHLEGYRNVWIELFTHAVDGLTENDFILAVKLDRLPVRLQKTA